jgi:Ca-activated chloride channel family protein
MKAINAALVQTRGASDGNAIRIVCFMTDGYVGNDMAIIDAIKKNADTTRVFSFGVGNSVNRYLLDGMAHAGRGEVEYVTLESQAEAAVERFHERVLAPVLTDIEIDWGTLPVADVYPKLIPDLFSAKPIMVHGRLTGPAAGTITLRGNTGQGGYEEQIGVSLPGEPPDHDALASLWARAKVEPRCSRARSRRI